MRIEKRLGEGVLKSASELDPIYNLVQICFDICVAV